MTQAERGNGKVPAFIIAGLAVLHAAVATNFTVGGSVDWDLPFVTLEYYNDWSSKQLFVGGDNLIFKYVPAVHDVQIVTWAEYISCVMSTGKKFTSGYDTIPLPKAGTYYFYCSVFNHCGMGMKMQVAVVAAANLPPIALPPSSPPKIVLPPPASPPPIVLPPPAIPSPVASTPTLPSPVASTPSALPPPIQVPNGSPPSGSLDVPVYQGAAPSNVGVLVGGLVGGIGAGLLALSIIAFIVLKYTTCLLPKPNGNGTVTNRTGDKAFYVGSRIEEGDGDKRAYAGGSIIKGANAGEKLPVHMKTFARST